ncbi:hypothetical protein [Bradyrhizobium iriomotense]|uniref:Haloacid dehalogenase n=1 Tax=Bradyrhizobium iriomotense TaxID=441950 RepID=A0ABQ6ASQ6_9BRAD|nr:hypothetical protein [Bradyrhizobium iriomotense]GLR85273.1 hypothetical protein GCM10007857_19830 [Bradyrhizobium iriomotense]
MSDLPLIVFDVNETLLDLRTMEPTFERIFGDARDMRLWVANFIMYSAALTVAGCYVPFTVSGHALLLRALNSLENTDFAGLERQPFPIVAAATGRRRYPTGRIANLL